MIIKKYTPILGLSIGVYFFIIILFFLLRDYIDLDVIRNNLLAKENITASNFVYVSLYISFVNSFLEELFFRGFMFLSLAKSGSRRFAYSISSLAFSLYHVAIISAWFNIWIFIFRYSFIQLDISFHKASTWSFQRSKTSKKFNLPSLWVYNVNFYIFYCSVHTFFEEYCFR